MPERPCNVGGMLVRPAELSDAEAIAAIYNLEVTESTATFDLVPRTLDQQRAWQVERSGAHAVLVAVDEDGTVVGFASLSPFRTRPAYSTTVENSVYVRDGQRGLGVGELLLREIVNQARSHGFHVVLAHISGGEASMRLHEKVGFEVVGRQREVGRKFGRWLDVVVMQLLLTD